ncbi:hypothetical protein NITMOv2_3806 [Nitrospira moscoviensis]|uniref:Uncharacterized protein n=1 Tax=Nitrospira moscoviensis TaxID=42253 RepID=A0A0K2GGY1_NITMO|nr:hypothetical protein NITMOv2_3806 [Nitrospira moscoviensis]
MRITVDRSLNVVIVSGEPAKGGSYQIVLTPEQALVAGRVLQVHAASLGPEVPEGKRYEPISHR